MDSSGRIANGNISFSNNRAVGSVATYECDPGYGPIASQRACNLSGWSGSEIICTGEHIHEFNAQWITIAKKCMCMHG